MQHNILSFWQRQENLPAAHADKLGPRTNRLLQFLFEQWKGKAAWPALNSMGHLFDLYKGEELKKIKALPVAVRKGLAIQHMLKKISDETYALRNGTLLIHPDELIIGTLPPYSVGQGKELMRYLTDEEALYNEIRYLNEWSPFGHIVPDHERIVTKGVAAIQEECRNKIKEVKGDEKKKAFYTSVIEALDGILAYADNYSKIARKKAELFPPGDERHKGLMAAAEHLSHSPRNPARSFAEALQCIHIMHCALHFTGEIVPIGRLDQILWPYYQKDLKAGKVTKETARELIECFWIKLDEKVVLNRRHLEDRFTSSDGALLGSGGPSNFDQGALLNQWMQQVTIGGVIADNEAKAKDASNELTMLCLETARRLPLNSPTLDLRVHKHTPVALLDAAAAALLSGGAHPVLLNDDKIIPALHKGTGGYVELKSARNYACDGCYETLFAGETEFSFGFVAAMDVLEKALNSGAGFAFSGPMYLRGSKGSFRSLPALEIKSFDQLWEIMRKHILLGAHKFLAGVLGQYGIKENVSPSPLLSSMINGCLETGRDLSGGGARYHLFSPLMTGISTATDSLYAIRKLVFEEKKFTLEELVASLRSNWGSNPEVAGLLLNPERIKVIRSLCLDQKKFGQGNKEVDEIAWKLINTFNECLQEARSSPLHKEQWDELARKYDVPGKKFEILLAPGVGTFEQYVFGGGFAGASADGRLAFDPIASDLSPAPLHSDQAAFSVQADKKGKEEYIHMRQSSLLDSLDSFSDPSIELLSDGAPCDLNIPEDFPQEKLTKALQAFASGKGSNVMTITVSNPETFSEAIKKPDQYDLLRVRMGGWTEFFITLFPAHKSQHQRRPLYVND